MRHEVKGGERTLDDVQAGTVVTVGILVCVHGSIAIDEDHGSIELEKLAYIFHLDKRARVSEHTPWGGSGGNHDESHPRRKRRGNS